VARYGGAAVTDADREACAAQLREHYAVGRLSLDEFQDRLDAVYRAQTVRELGMVTDSLPREGVAILPGMPWDGYRGGYPLDVAKMRAALSRAGRRIMLAFGIVTAGSLLVLTLLITALVVHGGLFGVVAGALLAILAVGVAAALPSAEHVDWPHLRRLARRFPRREPATANDLTTIIRGLVESTDGIRAATLTDLEGLPVVTLGPAAREMSQEILVAELTSFLKRVDRAAPEVGAGGLRSLVFDGEKGTAVVSRVNDDYSLILHVDPGAILGEVRWETERAARALGPAVR